jgi:catechol 2,3-dioxygenase-like lactoylglutathione lyase family enzyme
MRLRIAFRRTVLAFITSALWAQLPAPNAAGVAMGHLHLNTTDTEASRRFWVDFLGAAPAKLGNVEVYKFPDVLVLVRKAAVSGGSDGSAVNHLGFKVKDLAGMLEKCEKAGFRIVRRMPETGQAFVMAPDEAKVELTEDSTMRVPVAHHHNSFLSARGWGSAGVVCKDVWRYSRQARQV